MPSNFDGTCMPGIQVDLASHLLQLLQSLSLHRCHGKEGKGNDIDDARDGFVYFFFQIYILLPIKGWILLPIGSSIFKASLRTDCSEKWEEKESTDGRVWIAPVQDFSPVLPENNGDDV